MSAAYFSLVKKTTSIIADWNLIPTIYAVAENQTIVIINRQMDTISIGWMFLFWYLNWLYHEWKTDLKRKEFKKIILKKNFKLNKPEHQIFERVPLGPWNSSITFSSLLHPNQSLNKKSYCVLVSESRSFWECHEIFERSFLD